MAEGVPCGDALGWLLSMPWPQSDKPPPLERSGKGGSSPVLPPTGGTYVNIEGAKDTSRYVQVPYAPSGLPAGGARVPAAHAAGQILSAPRASLAAPRRTGEGARECHPHLDQARFFWILT